MQPMQLPTSIHDRAGNKQRSDFSSDNWTHKFMCATKYDQMDRSHRASTKYLLSRAVKTAFKDIGQINHFAGTAEFVAISSRADSSI
jgi:hypothetical protein